MHGGAVTITCCCSECQRVGVNAAAIAKEPVRRPLMGDAYFASKRE